MAGRIGGCGAIQGKGETGDSVIRLTDTFIGETVSFPVGESITETITESVSIVVS